jgi:hypothetical protein
MTRAARVSIGLFCLAAVFAPVRAGEPTSIQILVEIPGCGDGTVGGTEVCDPPGAVGQCSPGVPCSAICTCPVTGPGDIVLSPGFNLVSIPSVDGGRILPELLASIEGLYRGVLVYDPWGTDGPWKSYVPGRPGYLNGLLGIKSAEGFWIDMAANGLLNTSGTGDPVDYSIRTGWNLISYPTMVPRDAATAFLDVADALISVNAYQAAGSSWTYYAPGDPGSTLTTLQPGAGYWVETDRDDVWTWNGIAYERRQADLQISSVVTEPDIPRIQEGDPPPTTVLVPVTVAIHNAGPRDATDVEVRLSEDFEATVTLLQTYTFPSIPAHSVVDTTIFHSSTRRFDFEAGDHELMVEIDPVDLIVEEDETNNQGTYPMYVVEALILSIGQSPLTGEVPIQIDFTGTATGGVPPYNYWWTDSSQTSQEQNPSFIFSDAGSMIVEFHVIDSQDVHWSEAAFFDLDPSSAPEPAEFTISIADMSFVSASEVQIDLLANNTSEASAGARVIVDVYNLDDLTIFDETLLDTIVPLWGLHSEPITVLTGDLPNGNYHVTAKINPSGAFPEGNTSDNQADDSFVVSGSGHLPRFTVGPATFTPPDPMVGSTVSATVTLANNGPSDETVKATFSYENDVGTEVPMNQIRIQHVKPGEEVVYTIRWSIPPQPATTLFYEFEDFHGAGEILASGSAPLTITPFTYSLTDLTIEPNLSEWSRPETTNAMPLTISAVIHNESPVAGDIRYLPMVEDIEVDDIPIYNFPANSSRAISYTSQPGGLPGTYLAGFDLDTFFEGESYSRMYDWTLSDDSEYVLYDVNEGFACHLEDIVIDSPVVTRPGAITLTLKNASPHNAIFPFSIDVSYERWTDGSPVTDNLAFSFEQMDSIPRPLAFEWVPGQTGPHTVEITCGSSIHTREFFVQPRVTISDQIEEVLDHEGEWNTGHAEDFFVRQKLWTKASSFVIAILHPHQFNSSKILGRVYRQVDIFDGTTADNEYTADIAVEFGFGGIINTVEAGVGGTDYSVHATFTINDYSGVTPVACMSGTGAIPCKSTLFKQPGGADEWVDLALERTFAYGGKYLGEWLDSLYVFLDAIACEGTFARHKRVVFKDMKIRNGHSFMIEERLNAEVSSWSFGLGSGTAYVDFYNHSPHDCDRVAGGDIILPERGIWITDVAITATSVDRE